MNLFAVKPARRAAAIFVLLLSAAAPAQADRWASPKSIETLSPDRGLKAVLEPSSSGKEGGKLKVSEKTADGQRLLYEARLAAFPVQAFVSNRGAVVTVNQHHSAGYAHSVVVYSSQGELLRDYKLEDLLTPEEIAKNAPASVSSRHWLGNSPAFAFSDDNNFFQIRTRWGKSLTFNLASGAVQAV